MKVLLVNDYSTPTGGAELLMAALRDGLRQRGHDARLFTSCARPGVAASMADYECLGTTSRFRTLLQTANPWAFWQLRRVLREFRPDIVHVTLFLTQLSPLILPLLRDVPSLYYAVWYRAVCPLGTKLLPDGTTCRVPAGVACYHNRCLPLRDWGPLMVQRALWRRWRHAFDHVAAASQAVKAHLVAEGLEPVDVVWHGVPVQPRRPPLTSSPTVACAARLVPEKGTAVLVRAFAQVVTTLPEARLLLVGDGPERAQLTRLIDELGIAGNVVLLGYLGRAEMERHFQAAWVQAVPSCWAEPFALVAVEAMMRGTAVVASATGGLPELVQHGDTGLLVPPGDDDALAGALLRLLQDRALAERMGAAGREVALDTLSEATFVDRFLRLYATLGATRQHGE